MNTGHSNLTAVAALALAAALLVTGDAAGAFSRSYQSLRPHIRWHEWGSASITQVVTRPGHLGSDESPFHADRVAEQNASQEPRAGAPAEYGQREQCGHEHSGAAQRTGCHGECSRLKAHPARPRFV